MKGTDGQRTTFLPLAVRCPPMSEPPLSERDLCSKFITPAVEPAGWIFKARCAKRSRSRSAGSWCAAFNPRKLLRAQMVMVEVGGSSSLTIV